MSDLCAPIYVVMGGDEEMTFWCFVEVMNRMVCAYLLFRIRFNSCIVIRSLETKFPERSKRDEETAPYPATAY